MPFVHKAMSIQLGVPLGCNKTANLPGFRKCREKRMPDLTNRYGQLFSSPSILQVSLNRSIARDALGYLGYREKGDHLENPESQEWMDLPVFLDFLVSRENRGYPESLEELVILDRTVRKGI